MGKIDLSERQFHRIAGMIEGCEKKRAYRKWSLAEISAAHHDQPMRSYRCAICGMWHLTSK